MLTMLSGFASHEREVFRERSLRVTFLPVSGTGWMSRLETRAKPLIVGLMSDGITLENLNDQQCQLLARWAGKTAIIQTHAIGAECPVEGKLLQWMRLHEDAEPGRFAVVACRGDCGGIGHLQVGIITDLLGARPRPGI